MDKSIIIAVGSFILGAAVCFTIIYNTVIRPSSARVAEYRVEQYKLEEGNRELKKLNKQMGDRLQSLEGILEERDRQFKEFVDGQREVIERAGGELEKQTEAIGKLRTLLEALKELEQGANSWNSGSRNSDSN